MTESQQSSSQSVTNFHNLSETDIQKIGAYFAENDRAAKNLGVTLENISRGAATVTLIVNESHLNAHGGCHGGIIFLLADTAFSYACNTTGEVTVGLDCHISYLAAASVGEQLTAIATEENRTGKTGVYSIRVTNQKDELIALFRGQAYCLKKPLDLNR